MKNHSELFELIQKQYFSIKRRVFSFCWLLYQDRCQSFEEYGYAKYGYAKIGGSRIRKFFDHF